MKLHGTERCFLRLSVRDAGWLVGVRRRVLSFIEISVGMGNFFLWLFRVYYPSAFFLTFRYFCWSRLARSGFTLSCMEAWTVQFTMTVRNTERWPWGAPELVDRTRTSFFWLWMVGGWLHFSGWRQQGGEQEPSLPLVENPSHGRNGVLTKLLIMNFI